MVARSYSDNSIDLLPAEGCETPCLQTKCVRYNDGCTNKIPVDFVAGVVSQFSKDILSGKNGKIILRGNYNSKITFSNWEWKFGV